MSRREGAVAAFNRVVDTDDGDSIQVSVVQFDPDGDDGDADHYGPPGVDGAPIPGIDYVALADGTGTGSRNAVGYLDPKNAGKALAGEARLYSRDASGNIMAELWLKNDGSIVMSNANGSMQLASDGTVNANGTIVDTSGNVLGKAEVTAKANSAASVTLSQHLHPHPFGPTGAPTAGT